MSTAKLQQHLKVDSNVASFGGTVTTTVLAAEGASLRSVEKNAVLTERQLDDMYRRNNLHLAAGGGSNASLISSGTGDSASGGSSAASAVSSGVSTDSAELLLRQQQLQQQLQKQQQLQEQQLLLQQQQQQLQQQLQQQRFASLLTVERGPTGWVSQAFITFRYRSERLYYLDSANRLHGPMDQREQCQVASVRRNISRSSSQQPTVATRSHRAVLASVATAAPPLHGTLDDGLLLLEHRLTSSSSYGQQQPRQQWQSSGVVGGGVYSRVQVNQYDDWPLPRSCSQLDYSGAGGERDIRHFRRQHSSRDVQVRNNQHQAQPAPPPPPPQQHVQYYQRSYQHQHRRSGHPTYDARLEQLERSLNQAMESIRRQTSTSSNHHRHQQQYIENQSQHHQQQQYFEHQESGGELRRFSSEPPFEFRYSQRTMTHEPPQMTEEVETTTLQPIGRGIHDLGGGTRVSVQQHQQLQQQHSSVTEHRVSRSSRLAVRQQSDAAGGGGRSLSANRNATLRASTPVSPNFQQRAAPPSAGAGAAGTVPRGRHLSANPPRDYAQVY